MSLQQGKILASVTDTPIAASTIANWSADSSHGASNTFCGYVRNINLGKKVVAIEYDCFIPLTEKVFKEIALEAQAKWGRDLNIQMIHRYGRLNIGDISVVITVTSRHRDESYLASRYIIESIKTRAPVWKKEFYEDGATDWVRGHALCQHSPMSAVSHTTHEERANHEHLRNHSCGREILPHGH